MDDVLYISKRGKPRTIKTECYLIVTKMVSRDYRIFRKCQSLEITREEPKPEYGHQSDEEQDYSRADEIEKERRSSDFCNRTYYGRYYGRIDGINF